MVETPNNEVKSLVIENVAYIPDFHVNIVAGKTFHKRNLFWNPQAGYMQQNGQNIIKISKKTDFLILSTRAPTTYMIQAVSTHEKPVIKATKIQ